MIAWQLQLISLGYVFVYKRMFSSFFKLFFILTNWRLHYSTINMTRKNVIMLCKFIRYQSIVYLFLFVVKKIAKLQNISISMSFGTNAFLFRNDPLKLQFFIIIFLLLVFLGIIQVSFFFFIDDSFGYFLILVLDNAQHRESDGNMEYAILTL